MSHLKCEVKGRTCGRALRIMDKSEGKDQNGRWDRFVIPVCWSDNLPDDVLA